MTILLDFQVPFRLAREAFDVSFLLGFFYGAMAVTLLYNLMIYFTVRDRTYLSYVGFVIALSLSMFAEDGLARTYLWPDLDGWNAASFSFLETLTILFAIDFTRRYLSTSVRTPKAERVLRPLQLMCLLTLFLCLPWTYRAGIPVATFVSLTGPVALVTLGAISLKRGSRPARWYVLAASLLLFDSVLEAVITAFDLDWVTEGVRHSCTIMMMVSFSLGLTDRFNQAQRENERIASENRALQITSYTDALTGIWNRRRFEECLNQEWSRGRREGTTLALLLIDVDHFKEYNDSNGHQAGDVCLRRVARGLSDALRRSTDFLARYGGEEFAVILPATDTDAAAQMAESLRRAVAGLGLVHSASPVVPFVTISIGLATMVPSADNHPRHLVLAADRALYRAKSRGRNQVHYEQSTAPRI